MASRHHQKQALHQQRKEAKRQAAKEAKRQVALAAAHALPPSQPLDPLQKAKLLAEMQRQAEARKTRVTGITAVGWGLGLLTSAGIMGFAWHVGVFEVRDALGLFFGVGMMALMFGAVVGLGFVRLASNTAPSSYTREIRWQGLRLCLCGLAGVAAVAGVVGLMWVLDAVQAPVALKTVTAVFLLGCAPFGKLLLHGLAQLLLGDHQSTRA